MMSFVDGPVIIERLSLLCPNCTLCRRDYVDNLNNDDNANNLDNYIDSADDHIIQGPPTTRDETARPRPLTIAAMSTMTANHRYCRYQLAMYSSKPLLSTMATVPIHY